jgi:hypothetical protein
VSLGAAHSMTQGYKGPEVKGAYDRAYGLCGQIGESPHLFPALVGLFRFELTGGGNCRVRGRSRSDCSGSPKLSPIPCSSRRRMWP